MDETKRGIVVIDLLGDEPDVEGYGVESIEQEVQKTPKTLPYLPQPTLEIVPVSPVRKQ